MKQKQETEMSILNDKRIIENQSMIRGFSAGNVNPVSYDVTLHHVILRERHQWQSWLMDSLCRQKHWGRMDSPNRFQRIDISKHSRKNPFWMKQGDFILAATQEIFDLPLNISAEFFLKSSSGRLGFGHQLAGLCDPGWHGSRLTLELFNVCRFGLPLYPGLKIGQMVFQFVEEPSKGYGITGHYNGDKEVQPSRVAIID